MKRIAVLASFAALAVSASAAPWTFGAGGGAIPDNNVGGFSSSVELSGAVTEVLSVTIFGLKHTWSGDLIATLTSPTGSVDLFHRIGKTAVASGFGYSANFGTTGSDLALMTGLDYTFTTGGASMWTVAAANGATGSIAAGTYAATTNAFTGAAATSEVGTVLNSVASGVGGTWTLTISDLAGGDLGEFTGWQVEAVPEPGTMAALGLGLAALARRRKATK